MRHPGRNAGTTTAGTTWAPLNEERRADQNSKRGAKREDEPGVEDRLGIDADGDD